MFLCQICKSLSAPGESATRVVLERRVKVYPKGGGESVEGWEVVREALAHGGCALGQMGKEEKATLGSVTIGDVTPWPTDLGKNITWPTKLGTAEAGGVKVVTEHGEDISNEVTVEFTPEPVPVEKLEEVFGKPKKQKRTKKTKGEEAN